MSLLTYLLRHESKNMFCSAIPLTSYPIKLSGQRSQNVPNIEHYEEALNRGWPKK